MNAGNKAQVDGAAKREERLAARRLADWRWVMADARGRRVINEILGVTEMFGEVFHPSGSVANFNLGKRKVGLIIYSVLEEAGPENILLMRQEHVKEEQGEQI